MVSFKIIEHVLVDLLALNPELELRRHKLIVIQFQDNIIEHFTENRTQCNTTKIGAVGHVDVTSFWDRHNSTQMKAVWCSTVHFDSSK